MKTLRDEFDVKSGELDQSKANTIRVEGDLETLRGKFDQKSAEFDQSKADLGTHRGNFDQTWGELKFFNADTARVESDLEIPRGEFDAKSEELDQSKANIVRVENDWIDRKAYSEAKSNELASTSAQLETKMASQRDQTETGIVKLESIEANRQSEFESLRTTFKARLVVIHLKCISISEKRFEVQKETLLDNYPVELDKKQSENNSITAQLETRRTQFDDTVVKKEQLTD